MDMALDEFIKQNKPARGSRRSGGRGRGGRNDGERREGKGNERMVRGGGSGRSNQSNGAFPTRTRNVPDGRWTHDRYNEEGGRGFGLRTAGAAANATTKLLISNLDFGVSDSDVKELFSEFGALRRAAVHYEKSGRSLGSADVVFERRADAIRAIKQYNGVPLDGRPMKIQMLGENSPSGPAPQSSFGNKSRNISNEERRNTTTPQRRSRGAGRGGGRNKSGGPKPVVTQKDLDADLDAYINKME